MLKSRDIYWIHEQLFSSAAGEIPFAKALETVVDAFGGAIAPILPASPANISSPKPISILVYIWNPLQRTGQRTGNFGAVLARLYGFTLAETRLAAVIANGAGLNSAADQLGISRNTARNQLQSMFAKTGTHRQSEFLVRIMGILEY